MGENMKTIQEYINEIIRLKENIDNLRQYYMHKNNQFDKDVLVQKANIREAQANIEKIKNTEIPVRLEDILNNLCSFWKNQRHNLKINHFTNCTTDTADNFIEQVRHKQDQGKAIIHFTITENDEQNKFIKEVTFANKINLDSIQADGKTFEEHCFPQTSTYNGVTYTDLGIDNYKDLILNFPIRDLIFNKGNTYQIKDCIAAAVINAHNETFSQIKQEM